MAASPDVADDAHLHDWPAVYALSAGWALSFSVVTASITATNLASSAFSPSSSWNTVPLAFLIVSLSAWSLALPFFFSRLGGRLNTYRATSCVGLAASAIAAIACSTESFFALCVSSVLFGLPAAAGQSFRFAVLTLVPPRSRPKGIGLVLTGGIVGAVIGPLYAAASKNMFAAAPFAGVYLCTGIAFACLLAIVLAPGLVTFPSEGKRAIGGGAGGSEAAGERGPRDERTVSSAASKPPSPSAVRLAFQNVSFLCAVAVSALSYGAMSFLMSPTPLAMRDGGYSFDTVSHVIMSHMLGMYAPSFVTGGAVAKYGWKTIAAAGSLLFVVASLVMHDGVSLAHYVGGQLALGVAWNLCFVASSVEVARVSLATSRLAGGADEEKAKSAQKVQSAADVLTFAFAGAASVGSGAALARINWKGMQVVGWICACLMMLAVAVGALRSQDAPREKDGVLLKGALEGQGQGEEEKAGADERV